jgi:hypothetical protein
VGQTLSARHYADWDRVAFANPYANRGVFWTDEVLTSPVNVTIFALLFVTLREETKQQPKKGPAIQLAGLKSIVFPFLAATPPMSVIAHGHATDFATLFLPEISVRSIAYLQPPASGGQ